MSSESDLGIFLTMEGVPATVVESQVVALATMLNSRGIRIEVWTFAVTREAFQIARNWLSTSVRSNVKVRVFRGIRPALPCSATINALLLGRHLRKLGIRPRFLHARTAYAVAVAAITRKIGGNGFRLIWDSRGDTESEFRMLLEQRSSFVRLLGGVKIAQIRDHIAIANREADAAIFVSDALKELQCSPRLAPTAAVVPCIADQSLFFYSSQLRAEVRKRYGITEGDIVLVYSGSGTAWQCFDEMAKLVLGLCKKDRRTRAFIVTPEWQCLAHQFSEAGSHVIGVSVKMRQVNEFLNAADFAIFLRKYSPVNKVASPVKFIEYSLAGLPVIMTHNVEQATKNATKLGNMVPYNCESNFALPAKFEEARRTEVAGLAKKLFSIDHYITNFNSVYL